MLTIITYFTIGITLTLMPCSAFLLVVVAYRYFLQQGFRFLQYLTFIAGFILSFILIAAVVNFLGNNPIALSLKIFLSLFFVTLGILNLLGYVQLGIGINLPRNTDFLLGISLPLVLVLSPCGLPLFATIFVKFSLLSFVALILGALFPFIITTFFAKIISKLIKKISKFTYWLEKTSGIFFFLTGFYGLYTTDFFSHKDFLIFSIVLILTSFLFFLRRVTRDRDASFKLTNMIFFGVFLIIWAFIFDFCEQRVKTQEIISYTCGAKLHCPYCLYCYSLFVLFAILTAFMYVLSDKVRISFGKNIKKHKPKTRR